ncbi:MAG: PPC domain-containing protein [Chthoniobacteraceae bacterium]
MKRFAILASCIVPAISAWAGSPTVSQIVPAAAQRGTETEVLLSGGNLGDARTLLFDEPGIECVSISEVTAGKFKAKLKVAPDARIGEYVFRAITNSGIGDTRLFYVTPYPVVKEADEDPKDPYKLQPAKLGTTIYGTAPGEDQDHFEIEAKKGQRISAEVVGVRISTQTHLDAYLTVTDAAGKVLAEMDDCAYTRQDPALSLIAPEDGKYHIIIRDSTNSGGGPCNYLLHLGSHPRPTVVYPLGGMAGETVKFTMLGDAGGPFEQTVKLPAEPVERFEILAQKDGITAPQPNYIRVSPFPNVMEVEPNNTIETATPVKYAPPVALNGIIQEKGDVDYFKFTAQKGMAYEIHVRARMLRSPLDPVLEIYNEKGARLALNDDAGGPDSYLRWTAPTDGSFYLQVHDQLMRGGPLFTYRAEITKVEPALLTYLPEMVINSSQQRRAVPVPKGNRYATLVQVKRADVSGEALLDAKDLPPGVTATFDKVDKSVDRIAMVFEAKPDAAPAQKRFTILAKPAEPPKDTKVAAHVTHRVEVSENGNQKAYYGVEENALPIAVTDEVPVTINCVQSKVPVLQSGSMALKVAVERRNDYKGPIDIQVLYAPPGVGTPGIVKIPEGQNEGSITISANGKAPTEKWKTAIVGTVDTGKGPTWISTQLFDLDVAPPFVTGTIVRTFIDQGGEGSMTVKLDQKIEFAGKAKIALIGLPQGVTSEEREITKDDKDVKFPLKATPTAQVGQHKTIFASFTLVRDGETMTNTIASGGILRVDKGTPSAKVAAAKP